MQSNNNQTDNGDALVKITKTDKGLLFEPTDFLKNFFPKTFKGDLGTFYPHNGKPQKITKNTKP